jgi:hypothetical protein
MGPRLRGDDSGEVRGVLFTIKKYANSEIGLDFTVSVIMLRSSRSIVEGVFMRRLESGERERHLRAGNYAP